MKILIVDDDMISSLIVKTHLKKLFPESEFELSVNGYEAIKLFYCNQFDLVVSDLEMPVMNGIELARLIRNTSDVPIVIVSGDDNVQMKFGDLKNIQFQKKPISFDKLKIDLS